MCAHGCRKDKETTMVKLTFSSDYYEKAVKTLLRETKLSKLKGRLYSQVIENKK